MMDFQIRRARWVFLGWLLAALALLGVAAWGVAL